MLPDQVPFELGAGFIADSRAFSELAHVGNARGKSESDNVEMIKFVADIQPESGINLYWINTKNINMHPLFLQKIGLARDFGGPGGGRGQGNRSGKGRKDGGRGKGEDRTEEIAVRKRGEQASRMGGGKQIRTLEAYSADSTSVILRGDMTYLADERADSGKQGVFIFNLEPRVPPELASVVFKQINKTLPISEGRLAYQVPEETYLSQKQAFNKAGVKLYSDFEKFIALNQGSGIGKLRYLEEDTLPTGNDIVIAKVLPNEMPHVAGVITAVRQTPLSHVNLRAIQDKIPNAFIAGVLQDARITSLIGKVVKYDITGEGYSIREATKEEFAANQSNQQPKSVELALDLSLQEIRPLKALGFEDSVRIGAKAANVAALKHAGLPADIVPDGYAVPFYFYKEYIAFNHFEKDIDAIVSDKALISDKEKLEKALKALRKKIKKGNVPDTMARALSQVHSAFPEGTSLRCRSSTNNEDLPSFSGAGLYDSYTHHPHEGHLSKSIKQVYASLWNFRAFEAREINGIDHHQVAMGVLIHPNFEGELANGVAVTRDVLYGNEDSFYVNAQHGEDLVTNPDALSTPEELLLNKKNGFRLITPASDNRVVLETDEIEALKEYLAIIETYFTKQYHASDDADFAMEIEFKITADGKMAIKQARPWIN